MKSILKFGSAALLVALLAVPALAQKHHGGGTTHPAESSKEPTPAAPSPVPVPYPNVDRPKTPTGSQNLPSGVKAEAKPQPIPPGAKTKTNFQDIQIRKTVDQSSPR
jgi:hypothetical protein